MLQEWSARLVIPGLPEWTGVLALAALLLLLGCLLAMPFSVFGLKGRLDAIEAQLDELQAEIRGLTARLPGPGAFRDPEPPAQPRVTGRAEPRITWPRQD